MEQADAKADQSTMSIYPWQDYILDPTEIEETEYDAVIVGAGLGGGMIGRVLTERGLTVLFLEAGSPPQPVPRSGLAKKVARVAGFSDPTHYLASQGRWSRQASILRGKKAMPFHPIIGSGPGGSSAIYGAALERMKREDFEDKPVTGEGALPNAWPIGYDEWNTWYSRAEEMLSVCGTADPLDQDDRSDLRAPPRLSPMDTYLEESFRRAGLHPYRLHVAIEYRPGCAECIGRLCPRGCKADGLSRGLVPALKTRQAGILFGADVEAVLMQGSDARGVRFRKDGVQMTVRGRTVILAAGALHTPRILLNSRSPEWPDGVGNQNDLVGRGLMFHISDFIALRPKPILDAVGPRKTLSFRDFYSWKGQKLGSVQSVGIGISAPQIANFISDWFARQFGFALPGGPIVMRAIGMAGARIFRNAALFATIQEDFAFRYNRVTSDPTHPERILIDYRKSDELESRIATFRALLKEKLAELRVAFLSGNDNINIGHACGSCRMGDRAETSVVGPDSAVWGTGNVYVVDASFFPSSSGANPSLTVVANALRVGDLIAARLTDETPAGPLPEPAETSVSASQNHPL